MPAAAAAAITMVVISVDLGQLLLLLLWLARMQARHCCVAAIVHCVDSNSWHSCM
jgi:hypothetical protein